MTHATRKNVGQRVRALREESNLTQEQLALMTGVERSYLAKVEAGNRNATIDFMDTIEKQGFTIDNPNATSTCACGDSFH